MHIILLEGHLIHWFKLLVILEAIELEHLVNLRE